MLNWQRDSCADIRFSEAKCRLFKRTIYIHADEYAGHGKAVFYIGNPDCPAYIEYDNLNLERAEEAAEHWANRVKKSELKAIINYAKYQE